MFKRFFALLLVCLATPAVAQQTPAQPSREATLAALNALELPDGFDGATPPQLPEVVSRDGEGRTTVRAIRLTSPLELDGRLDEEFYRTITPISDFIQAEPQNGEPATEKTEVWISFDDKNIYVSMRATESQPDRMIVNEMRRDSFNVTQNENFQFVLDTFHDRRNAVAFQFNPLGGRMDGQVSNESQYNGDWNPIWDLHVRRETNGWTAEAAVPFKSLRYRPGETQIWGFQARRINRWKNETSYLTRLPAGVGLTGFQRASLYATMVGLQVPSGSRPLDIKPYVISNVSTNLAATPEIRNKIGKDFGFDAKYAVTQNLGADFTYNTDFAQVEADEEQVNLSRFSLFFPEKREFFLENQGLFNFGNIGNFGGGETPRLFYSRRIGLDSGVQVPLDVGGRLSGQVGRYSIGVMNIQTGDDQAVNIPSANFAVARVKRDILRRSSVGALYTRRSVAANRLGAAETIGLDGSFSFFQNLSVNTYWAQTRTPGVGDDDTSYRGQLQFNGDRYAMQAERLAIGEDFNPEVGFMRREDFHKTRGMFRFSPRPRNRFTAVRKFSYQVSTEYFTNSGGDFESRERRAEFSAEFQTSDEIQVTYEEQLERLVEDFDITDDVTVPIGDYHYGTLSVSVQAGQQRKVSGNWSFQHGSFYGGDRTTVGYSRGRVRVNEHLAFEPGFSVNRVSLPGGDFTSKVVSTRTTYTLTPLMFVSGLVQYNSGNSSFSTNVRLRWEYQPGSELFIVYNDGRDTTSSGLPRLQNRSLVVKANRLFRF